MECDFNIGTSRIVLQKEAMQREIGQSPANFGSNCERHCMCEVQGQQPCSATIIEPKYLHGQWRWNANLS